MDQKYVAAVYNTVGTTQITALGIPRRVGAILITSAGSGGRIQLWDGNSTSGIPIFDANPPTIGYFPLYAYCHNGICVELTGTTSPECTITTT